MRIPSSVALRKTRMAISLRFATSSFLISVMLSCSCDGLQPSLVLERTQVPLLLAERAIPSTISHICSNPQTSGQSNAESPVRCVVD